MRSSSPWLVALLSGLLLSLLCLWPSWWQPQSLLLGGWAHPDCLSNHWLLAWVADRLLSGESILHNPDYYWPVGDAPVLAGNGVEGVLYLPFHALLGWPTAVPFYVLAVFTLNGLSGYAVARAAGAGPWESLAAVGVSVCFPYTLQEISAGRFTQAAICWPGFALAAWISLLQAPSRRSALRCGLLTAVAGFFYWYHALFVCLADAVLLVTFLLARQPLPWRAVLLAASSALFWIAPWALLFASAWSAIPGAEEAFPSIHSAHRSAPLWPRWLIGEGAESFYASAAPLGLLGLLGAGWAVRWGDWRGRGLLGVALLAGWLALGPNVSVSAYEGLYGLAAPLRRFWWPLRHVVLVNVAWGTLAALALTRLPLGHGVWRRGALGLGALVLVPVSLGLRGIPISPKMSALSLPPPVYPALAAQQEEDTEVLLSPPLWPGLASAQQPLIYQRVHGMRLLTGHALWVDRLRPLAWDAFVDDNSFLTALQRLEQGRQGGPVFQFEASDLQALRAGGVRWFVVDQELFPLQFKGLVREYRALGAALFGEPSGDAPGIRAWDMRSWDGETSAVEVGGGWVWPAGVRPGGPDIAISGRRFPSPVFSDIDGDEPRRR